MRGSDPKPGIRVSGSDERPLMIRRLQRAELPADTVELARFLIGKVLVHEHAEGRVSGRIVETEAYPVGDAASHAFRRLTPRNRAMFLERGHAYVYLAYGVSCLLNVSSEGPGIGAAVLLRALEPLDGIAEMQARRGTARIRDLARGPGRLAQAMGVDLSFDGLDLCDGPLWLGAPAGGNEVRGTCGVGGTCEARDIGRSVRIGITKDADRLLRFYERGNSFVSGPKRLNL
jgi:DNA-3-methyladenine glycosylase